VRLDRALTWGLVSLAFVAVGLPLYWLREPGRQEGAERGFAEESVERGELLFASTEDHSPHPAIPCCFGCADCHGPKGQGAVANYTLTNPDDPTDVKQVQWRAPALNTVFLRFNRDEVRQILVYGRPNTPMPAWGVEGGGAMSDQMIDDLVNYLESIQIGSGKARREAAQFGTDGKALFNEFCARCHTKGWSYRDSYQEPDAVDGGGAFGPNLTAGVTLRQFPAEESHVEFITEGSEFQEPYGRRGIGSGRMPGFGGMLSQEQIEAVVRYERGL